MFIEARKNVYRKLMHSLKKKKKHVRAALDAVTMILHQIYRHKSWIITLANVNKNCLGFRIRRMVMY